MRSILAVLLLTSVAWAADEGIAFHAPSGWTVDGKAAKDAEFAYAAVEDATGVRMFGKIEHEPMAANDEGVTAFLAGAKSEGTRVTEVRHDFPDVGGRRAIRIVFDMDVGGVVTHSVGYLIPARRATVFLMFASTDAIGGRIGDFDKIAQATTLPPPPPSLSYRLGYATGQLLVVLAIIGLVVFFIVRASRKPAA